MKKKFIKNTVCTLVLLTMCITWGASAQKVTSKSCDPVQDLTGVRNQQAGVDLTWKNPDGYSEHLLQWDKDICHSAVGASGGLYYATAYNVGQLTSYVGKTIRRVGFLPYMPDDENATANIQLCIWVTNLPYVRPDAPTYTQSVTNYTPGEWTNVELDTPFTIPAGKHIYVGFYATYTGEEHPATFNFGVGENGFSNLISTSGQSFSSYAYEGTVVSWLIHTVISDQPADKESEENDLISLPSHAESATLPAPLFNKRGIAINTDAINDNILKNNGLKGYEIYRDDVLLKTTSRTSLADIFVPQGEHRYSVKALYDGSCTESTPVIVTVADPCTTPQIETLPYQEGFENGLQCWGQELVMGDPFSPTSWAIRTGSPYNIFSAHSGTLNAYFSGDYLHSSAKLVSPKMDLNDISTPYLTFFHMHQRYQEGTATFRDTLKVYYKTESAPEWTLLETYSTADTWVERSIILPNPGTNYQIAFEGIAAWGSGILLDDIAITDGDPCAVPVSLNLEEGFNTPAFPPACWTSLNIGGSGTGYFQPVESGNGILPACHPHSGDGLLRYKSSIQSEGAKAQLITPLLDLPNEAYSISFWVFRDEMPAKEDRINVYFNTEKNTDGLTPLITVHRAKTLAPATEVSGWNEYRVNFDCSTTNTGYVIIEAVSDRGYDIHFDDVLIGNLCLPVTDLDFSIDENNVSLSWSAPEVSTGFSGYNIYRNDSLINTISDVETTTFTDNDLSQNGYVYCVEAAYDNTCGVAPKVCTPIIAVTNSGSCNRPRGVTFVAHQPEHYNVKLSWYPPQSTAKATSIFEEGFNSGISNSWKNMDKDGDEHKWQHSLQYSGGTTTPAPYAGEGCAFSESFINGGIGPVTPDNWLISPAIEIIGKCELKYYVGAIGALGGTTDYSEHYGVYVSTTGTDYEDFTLLQEETMTSAAWEENIVDLTDYAGKTVYFAFRHFNCTDQYIFKLDEVSVTMIDDATIVGYNVYRDNVKLNKTPITEAEYLDLLPAAGNYTYGISAVWPDYCESAQARVNVYMPGSQCELPAYLPFIEDFNEETFPKPCWTNQVEMQRQWKRVTSGDAPTCSPHTGAGMIKFQSLDYSAGVSLKLTTPMLQVDDAGDYFRYKISFWLYREGLHFPVSGRADKVNLYLSPTPATTDLEPVLTVHRYIALPPVIAAEGWYKYEVEVDRPFDIGYVTLEGVSAWGRNIYVDDLSVDAWAILDQPCDPPTNVAVTTTYTDDCSAQITWTEPESGSGLYNIYRDNTLIASDVTGTSYSDNDFSTGQQHNWCVKTVCDTIESVAVCASGICNLPSYTITVYAESGGKITPNTNVTVYQGDDQTFTITPNAGYKIKRIMIDDVDNPEAVASGTYTFSDINENHSIRAYFERITYTITVTAGEGGSINPEGNVTVNHGNNKTFTITPDDGYKIAQVLIDNVNDPVAVANKTYTFSNITADHTIAVSFELIPVQYTINATAGTGGTITPNGDVTIDQGSEQTFQITPDEGFVISQILVDDVNDPDAVASGSYTFSNVTENHTIQAVFEAKKYSIEAIVGEGGSITPDGTTEVSHGASQTYAITPEEGYAIKEVLVDGTNNPEAVASGTYTFENVVDNHSIEVNFSAITFTITASVEGGNGSITPDGATNIGYGESQTYTITPEEGYKIDEVLIDGTNNPEAVAAGTYTFDNVTDNHKITAKFTLLSGINENENGIDIQVYPNPTTGKITIKSTPLAGRPEGAVLVFDITGRLVLEVNNIDNNETTIDLSKCADGIYFIKIDEKMVKVIKK